MTPLAPKATWRGSLAAILLTTLLLGSGCWDRKEIEDMGFVMAIGLDRGPGESLLVTFQVANPRAIAGGAGGGTQAGPETPPLLVETIQETAIDEAIRNLETMSNRRISLVQLRVLVLGRELAESGLAPAVASLTRSREIRQTMVVMMAERTAEEILRLHPVMERDPSLFLEDLTRRAYERTATAPRVHLHDFLEAYETLGKEPFLPIVRATVTSPGLDQVRQDTKAMLRGTALFHGDRLCCELSGEETEALLMLSRRSRSFIESVPLPDQPDQLLSLELATEQYKVMVDLSGRQPRISIAVILEAQLRESQNLPPRWVTPEANLHLGQYVGEQIEGKANRLLKRLQEECRADALGLGEALQSRFLDYAAWERYDWPARFPQVALQAQVQVRMRRNGMTLQTPVPR